VAKHAGAGEAAVQLHCQPGRIELCIRDDGLGFDPASLSPNSLGLGIMRERVEAIGAELRIESRLGTGTEVRVVWTTGEGR
jgi:signal transduction histidine kinase